MTVVLTVDSCQIDLTPAGFVVMRDGAPVPPQVHPPALLAFFSKSDARAFAEAIDSGDQARVDELVKKGRWWA